VLCQRRSRPRPAVGRLRRAYPLVAPQAIPHRCGSSQQLAKPGGAGMAGIGRPGYLDADVAARDLDLQIRSRMLLYIDRNERSTCRVASRRRTIGDGSELTAMAPLTSLAIASPTAASVWPVDSTTQRRSKLALMPCAIATRDIDTPSPRHCATSSALNSLVYRRRPRPGSNRDEGIVFTCPPKNRWERASFTPSRESRVGWLDSYGSLAVGACPSPEVQHLFTSGQPTFRCKHQ
jgi:hypothetical protein